MIVRDLFTTLLRDSNSSSPTEAKAPPALSRRLVRAGTPRYIGAPRKGRERGAFLPGDGREDSCVYALLGRDAASSMLRCSGDMDGMKLGLCILLGGAGQPRPAVFLRQWPLHPLPASAGGGGGRI